MLKTHPILRAGPEAAETRLYLHSTYVLSNYDEAHCVWELQLICWTDHNQSD